MRYDSAPVQSDQAILDQIERRERRQRLAAVGLFLVLGGLFATFTADFLARPRGRDVIGEVVRFGTDTSNWGAAYWVDVKIEGESVVRAPLDKPAAVQVGEQVVVSEITTPIFGFRRYVCTGAVGTPRP